jgi:cell fate (sporulation/competence/biofilm development) regulator YlbF (YheA/YmcA/DUF963 family)
MEEILEKAAVLGTMIRESQVYKKYNELAKKLEQESTSVALYDEFTRLSQMLAKKEQKAEPVEVWEKEKYQELAQKVAEDEILPRFIEAQTVFMDLMVTIQRSINTPVTTQE